MDEINSKYLAAAAKLGDIEFQISLLNMSKSQAVQEIHELNSAMAVLRSSQAPAQVSPENEAKNPQA